MHTPPKKPPALSLALILGSALLWCGQARAEPRYVAFSGGQLHLLAPSEEAQVEVIDLGTGELFASLGLRPNGQLGRLLVPQWVEVRANAELFLLAGDPEAGAQPWAGFVPSAGGGPLGTRISVWSQGELVLVLPRPAQRDANPTIAIQDLTRPERSTRLTERSAFAQTPAHLVFRLAGLDRDALQISMSHPGAAMLLHAPDPRGGWALQPVSTAAGEESWGLLSQGVFWAPQVLQVYAPYADTQVELRDLSDGDDAGEWGLRQGRLEVLSPSAEGLGGLDEDLIELRASRPVLVAAGRPSEARRGFLFRSAPLSSRRHAALALVPGGWVRVLSGERAQVQATRLDAEEGEVEHLPPSAWGGVGTHKASMLLGEGVWLIEGDAPFVGLAEAARGCCGPWPVVPLEPDEGSAPKALGGADLRVCPRQPASLDGRLSFDADGEGAGIVAWRWDLNLDRDSDGRGGVDDDADADQAQITVRWPTSGRARVRLRVVDNEGQQDTDDVSVEVLPPSSVACGGDEDGDGIGGDQDVCPLVADPSQADLDGDKVGDACDEDLDGDGRLNHTDNCPRVAGGSQADLDRDGVGDPCDPDVDGDGLPNEADNCPQEPNRTQADLDGDTLGDPCDEDDDGDGVPDDLDRCPQADDPEQTDTDNDGLGDACDRDDDGDGRRDSADNCPLTPNPDQRDANRNGVGDACDSDLDEDGVPDDLDRCPLTPDAGQQDADGDGLGDACDPDADGDLVDNARDNCPSLYNPRQTDDDANGVGDDCERDADADALPDARDNCPLTPNREQRDLDGDGLGDACDPDVDGDGLGAARERALGTRPDSPDTDGDGLGDGQEAAQGSDPTRWDTDGDSLDDGTEVAHGLNPLRADSDFDGVADGAEPGWNEDSDLDGLINAADPDADNGGVLDGGELRQGRDMLDPTDDLLPYARVQNDARVGACQASAGGRAPRGWVLFGLGVVFFLGWSRKKAAPRGACTTPAPSAGAQTVDARARVCEIAASAPRRERG